MLTQSTAIHHERIRISGLVQGVGFRPAVWQLAQEFNIQGEVRNDGSGVQIIAQSSPEKIQQMLSMLHSNPPLLARIDNIQREVIEATLNFEQFSISQSIANDIHTGMVADAATCDACLHEINDPQNRRYGYAFTNCTHCGPRLSIVKDLPYDRANTSMAEFTLCNLCQQEYNSADDRRFHAQPNACPHCGPKLWLSDNEGNIIHCEQPVIDTVALIKQGKIVAIKGIGGFQLACDASNEQVVGKLRKRKNRPHKALALMAGSLEQIKRYCHVSATEASLLQSPAAPIVLLDVTGSNSLLANNIAAAQKTLGFMLPNTPVHHLLMQNLQAPIVLTSGNVSNQPQCIDNQQVLDQLGHIADVFLMHNRDIVNRIDDSVVRKGHSQIHIYRRARGYAPVPVNMPEKLHNINILACGSELKNTFCLQRDGKATLSQHIGNLDNTKTFQDYLYNLKLYHQLFQFKPQAIAVDMHPHYQSSKYGRQLANELRIPLIEVQHHHAHIASCLAENNWYSENGKVIGVAMDGLGFGKDGSMWGGEFLVADYQKFERKARLKPVPMPGGNKASLEPWRNTFAHLHTHCDWSLISKQYSTVQVMLHLDEKPLKIISQMMKNSVNSPPSSSCGRLFDGVAFALGICPDRQSYEGQAAIELENLIDKNDWLNATAYPFAIENKKLLEINPAPMWSALLNDLNCTVSPSTIAASFHLGLAQAIAQTIQTISASTGIMTVALSGGVFQNISLLEACQKLLKKQSFTVLTQQQVPANDGGLSLGQVAIAAAQLGQKVSTEKEPCV